MNTERVIGKCSKGHTVNTTADQVRAGWITCDCGANAMAKWMTVKVVETMTCSDKCTSATSPVCSCSCGGEQHGGRHAFTA